MAGIAHTGRVDSGPIGYYSECMISVCEYEVESEYDLLIRHQRQ